METDPHGEIKKLLEYFGPKIDENTINVLIDFLPVGIAFADLEGKIICSNLEARRIIQTNGRELDIRRPDGSVIKLGDCALFSSIHNEEMGSQEVYVRTGNGTDKVLLASCSSVYTDNQPFGSVLVFQDITANKSREVRIKQREQNIKTLINAITEAMVLIDLKGKIIHANDTASDLLKIPIQELISQNLFGILPSDIMQQYQKHIQVVVAEGKASQYEGGQTGNFYKFIFSPVFDSKHKVTKIAILTQNITDSKRIERAFKDSEARFRNIFENTASGIALVSLEGNYFLVNEAMSSIVGYATEELSNMTFKDITYTEDLKKELKMIEKLVRGEVANYQLQKRYIHKNGSIVWVLLTRSLVRDSNGDPFYTIGQIQNITVQKQVEEELKQAKLEAEEARARAELLARTDYLTGLLNRRAFRDRLAEEEHRAIRMNAGMTIVLADIDYYKRFNDTYGHKAGDIVLQVFSECIKNICRPYDFIGRYGGEEFVICLVDVGFEQGNAIAERMRVAVESLKIDLPDCDKELKITASFGLAASGSITARSGEKLIERADQMMYQAKKQGRNKVVAEWTEL